MTALHRSDELTDEGTVLDPRTFYSDIQRLERLLTIHPRTTNIANIRQLIRLHSHNVEAIKGCLLPDDGHGLKTLYDAGKFVESSDGSKKKEYLYFQRSRERLGMHFLTLAPPFRQRVEELEAALQSRGHSKLFEMKMKGYLQRQKRKRERD